MIRSSLTITVIVFSLTTQLQAMDKISTMKEIPSSCVLEGQKIHVNKTLENMQKNEDIMTKKYNKAVKKFCANMQSITAQAKTQMNAALFMQNKLNANKNYFDYEVYANCEFGFYSLCRNSEHAITTINNLLSCMHNEDLSSSDDEPATQQNKSQIQK